MNLFLRLLDKTDPTASMHKAAYGLVIACACAWLTIALFRPAGLNSDWVAALGLLLAAVTTGKVLGKPAGVAAPAAPADPRAVPAPGTDTNGGTP